MKLGYKLNIIGAMMVAVASVAAAPAALAWGPERPMYTVDAPAKHATFNSISDNAAVGDERDFVRIVEKNSGNEYTSNLTIEAGKQYEVYIYYHNDASATYNDKAHDYVGIARETRLISDFPDELAEGEMGRVLGKITSSTTEPKEVWDEAYVTAKQAMTLHYVAGSAKIYNAWNETGTILSTEMFSNEGTFIGLAKLNGVILGCNEYSGSIRYTIQTVAVEAPVEPEKPDPEVPTPEVPKELPTTGPVEVVLVIVVLGLIIAGIVYAVRSHKAVKKTAKKAKGKK